MTRWLVLLAASALVFAANAGAQPRAQKAEAQTPERPKAPTLQQSSPLHLYLAKGEPNACGEGCSEWIAVEGRFDPGAAARAQAFLRRHAARKLPVFFHSPGGSGSDAIALGRLLRQLGSTVGVAATVPRGCASGLDTAAACVAAKRSPQPVEAEWRPTGICNSACVWALLGGKVRHVPPSARLGVHSGKMILTRRWSDGRVEQVSPQAAAHKARVAESNANSRRYMREMGIDTALMDEALKIPHEDIRYLSRSEVAAFGIDRREFAETPWFFSEFANGTRYVSKWIAEAAGSEPKHYRVSVVLLRCSGPHHVAIQYVRGLVSGEGGQPTTATFGKLKPILFFRGMAKQADSLNTGMLFVSGTSHVPVEGVEAVAAAEAFEISEGGYATADQSRDLKLSTRGLADGIKVLRAKCAPPAVDATKPPPELPKNVWNPKGLHLPPDWKPGKRAN